MTVSAVIAAAGSSTRMGFDKLALRLDEYTVLQHSVLAFDRHPQISELVLVTNSNGLAAAQQAAQLCAKPCRIVMGGATRAESVRNGVQAASGELVAIHDAARPYITQEVISRTLAAAAECGAAAPAVPVKDTIKTALAGNGKQVPQGCLITGTPARSTLYAAQTPQCFYRTAYLNALAQIDDALALQVTDDCSLYELMDRPVQLVQGDYTNLKITTREDIPAPKEEKPMLHIGHGYDVHRLVEGRRLILGGVDIPFAKGLLGHSDADVLAHAIMDALLGAAAMGDIGQHFPDNDPAYEGADSLQLMREVKKLLEAEGWQIENIDSTILCQAPKLMPHIPAMRANLAGALGLEVSQVSVKATTEEHLGFTGSGEGIAVHAVALISK